MAFLVLILAICASGCSSLLYYPRAELFTDPSKFRHHPEQVAFHTADGIKLHGWFFRSPIRPAKATFLFFHGNAQNLSTHFYALYWAIDQGFDYFIFDYRGYGQSEGKPSPEGTVQDGLAALTWLTEHHDPNSKIVIFGQSLGGAIALKVACEAGDRVSEVIVDSTFHSYRSVARKVLANGWLSWPFQWLGWLTMSDEFAPKRCLKQISPRPLLIVHGTADHVVPFSLGQAIYQLADEPKEFWPIEGGQHTDFLFRDGGKNQKRLQDWVVSHLSEGGVLNDAEAKKP